MTQEYPKMNKTAAYLALKSVFGIVVVCIEAPILLPMGACALAGGTALFLALDPKRDQHLRALRREVTEAGKGIYAHTKHDLLYLKNLGLRLVKSKKAVPSSELKGPKLGDTSHDCPNMTRGTAYLAFAGVAGIVALWISTPIWPVVWLGISAVSFALDKKRKEHWQIAKKEAVDTFRGISYHVKQDARRVGNWFKRIWQPEPASAAPAVPPAADEATPNFTAASNQNEFNANASSPAPEAQKPAAPAGPLKPPAAA